jgi:hypothetical protein
MLSYARRLTLLGIVGGAVLASGSGAGGRLSDVVPPGETAVCVGKPSARLIEERPFAAPQLQQEPEKPKAGAVATPSGPRASRERLALFSAPPPEKTFCEPLPAWSIGLRPIAFDMPDLHRIEPHLRYFAESPGGRAIVHKWLRRAGKYRHLVVTALHNNHLPLDLQALVYIESGFSPNAVSKAGAVGLWQLMPSTARNLGLRVDNEVDERRNVVKSTDAAVEHLSELYATFGSWDLVFAAYDLGAKRLMRKMQDHHAMDYWSLSAIDGALPAETNDYVPKLLAFAVLLRNLDRFGFEHAPVDKPLFTSELDVPAGTTFALLARAAATSVFHLREINADILNGRKVPLSVSTILVPSFGLSRAQAMLPHLLKESDGLEDAVGEDFDWAKDHVDMKQLPGDLVAKAKKAVAADRLAGFEDDHGKTPKWDFKHPPRALDLPSSPRSESSASAASPKPADGKSVKRPAKRLPS